MIEPRRKGRLCSGRAANGVFGSRMMKLKYKVSKILAVFGLAGFATVAGARESEPAPAAPVVVELFSSQACSACVKAADYFRELSKHNDIVALSWHVDYWNYLNTKHGRWTDPYSSADNTGRQRQYNINLRKRSSVYTPQMVVGGDYECIGSSREKVSSLIEMTKTNLAPVSIDAGKSDQAITFDIGASATGGNAYLVTFKPHATTKIKSGENAGVDYIDTNVVTNVERLGVIRRIGATLSVAPPAAGDGCALLIQEPGQGRIVAARYCPAV